MPPLQGRGQEEPDPSPSDAGVPWHRKLLVLLAAVAGLRLGLLWLAAAAGPTFMMSSDSDGYENPARALLQVGRFAQDPAHPEKPELKRTPGYPLFIALVYGLFGESRTLLIAVQVLVGVATIGLACLLVHWDRRAGLAAAVFLALDPVSTSHSLLMLTETLFTFVLVVALLLTIRLLTGHGAARLLALGAGAAFAAATLVRPISYFVIVPVVAVVWFALCRRGWGRATVLAGLTLLPSLLLIGGWQWMRYRATGEFGLSSITAKRVVIGRAFAVIAARDDIPLLEARCDAIAGGDQTRRAACLAGIHLPPGAMKSSFRLALEVFLREPLLAVKLAARGAATVLFAPSGELGIRVGLPVDWDPGRGPTWDLLQLTWHEYWREWPQQRTGHFLFWLQAWIYLFCLYAAVLVGAWSAVRSRGPLRAVHVLMASVLLYFLAASSGHYGNARFRVPLMPILALYAGLGVVALQRHPKPTTEVAPSRRRVEAAATVGGG